VCGGRLRAGLPGWGPGTWQGMGSGTTGRKGRERDPSARRLLGPPSVQVSASTLPPTNQPTNQPVDPVVLVAGWSGALPEVPGLRFFLLPAEDLATLLRTPCLRLGALLLGDGAPVHLDRNAVARWARGIGARIVVSPLAFDDLSADWVKDRRFVSCGRGSLPRVLREAVRGSPRIPPPRAAWLPGPQPPGGLMREAVEAIESLPDLGVGLLARALGVSRFRLEDECGAVLGCAPRDLLQRYRIAVARAERGRGATWQQVARLLGDHDGRTVRRRFRNMGLPLPPRGGRSARTAPLFAPTAPFPPTPTGGSTWDHEDRRPRARGRPRGRGR
jgi:AraC-like DNA-binding protein